jgi:hypothetical protein
VAKDIPAKYRKHFRDFDDVEVGERVASFGLDASVVRQSAAVVICQLRDATKWVTIKKVRPWEPYIHELRPRTVHDLKRWVGIPHEVAEKNDAVSFLRQAQPEPQAFRAGEPPVGLHDLPTTRSFTFKRLGARERLAVRDVATQLLYGEAHDDRLKEQPYAAVVKYMLEEAKALPAFVGKDLLVCPGHTVSFPDFAVVYFNNVVLVGDGQVVLGRQAKLHAQQITRV